MGKQPTGETLLSEILVLLRRKISFVKKKLLYKNPRPVSKLSRERIKCKEQFCKG